MNRSSDTNRDHELSTGAKENFALLSRFAAAQDAAQASDLLTFRGTGGGIDGRSTCTSECLQFRMSRSQRDRQVHGTLTLMARPLQDPRNPCRPRVCRRQAIAAERHLVSPRAVYAGNMALLLRKTASRLPAIEPHQYQFTIQPDSARIRIKLSAMITRLVESQDGLIRTRRDLCMLFLIFYCNGGDIR